MSHFFYSFPGKAEKERRSESIRSLANYERRFKRHVSLYVRLFIACIKFQFCRIHPFVVAYIILKKRTFLLPPATTDSINVIDMHATRFCRTDHRLAFKYEYMTFEVYFEF